MAAYYGFQYVFVWDYTLATFDLAPNVRVEIYSSENIDNGTGISYRVWKNGQPCRYSYFFGLGSCWGHRYRLLKVPNEKLVCIYDDNDPYDLLISYDEVTGGFYPDNRDYEPIERRIERREDLRTRIRRALKDERYH